VTGTAMSRWLGEEFRRKRVKARMKPEAAAQELEWSLDKLHALEHGELVTQDVDIIEYLLLFRTPRAELRRFVLLARECHDDDLWLQHFDADSVDRFRTTLREEARATGITGYGPMLVPGPLRTSAYSRALCGLDQPRHDPPTGAVFYLDENVPRRMVGGPEVMRDQVAHLLACPVTIRLVPAACTVVCEEEFTFLDNADRRPVVHVPLLVADLFLERPDHVDAYRRLIADLDKAAWDVDTSRTHLETVALRNPVSIR